MSSLQSIMRPVLMLLIVFLVTLSYAPVGSAFRAITASPLSNQQAIHPHRQRFSQDMRHFLSDAMSEFSDDDQDNYRNSQQIILSSTSSTMTDTNTKDTQLAATHATVVSADRPRVVWKAASTNSVRVKEKMRSVEAYMALPASQYSVLSAKQIARLSETDFKCTLGTMNFFGTRLTPVLYVSVTVTPSEAKSVIAVTRAEILGEDAVIQQINGAFSIQAINTVTAQTSMLSNGEQEKRLQSETTLEIDAALPANSKLPVGLVRRSGNFLMQSSLSIIVPTFVRILAADFHRWTAGDDSRAAVEGAELNIS